jgi:hypothetical protein
VVTRRLPRPKTCDSRQPTKDAARKDADSNRERDGTGTLACPFPDSIARIAKRLGLWPDVAGGDGATLLVAAITRLAVWPWRVV